MVVEKSKTRGGKIIPNSAIVGANAWNIREEDARKEEDSPREEIKVGVE